jgi:RNA-binding protein
VSDEKPAAQPGAGPASEVVPLPELTGKQRRHLRALGHHLSPVLHIGHEGVTGAVVKQAEQQLEAHELIKVKVAETAPEGRHDAAGRLASATRSHLAQVLGRTFLLYRRRKKDPAIALPKLD